MIRAAIYARFSTDLQNEKSIEDQIVLCRDICAREAMAVVSTFEDRAVSGSATVNRPGFLSLMKAAEAGLFDAIVAEDVDRVFRDQADYHLARKQIDHIGIAFHTASGKVGKIDGALRALMSELFIENLAIHTRRGLDGVVRDGRHAGGRAYGYRAVAGKPGELEIVEAEAEIIREIFALYVAGQTPRAIAAALNARNVPAARGRAWNASSINGNYGRGGGILLNDLYDGRIVWNKVRMIKHPITRKRISRSNPKDQHRVAPTPHLRIVDAKTFAAAQAIKHLRHRETPSAARAPKRALSGLIKCGSCGGAMASIGSDRKGMRVQCSAHRESSTCDNGRRVYVDEIEGMTFGALRQHLANPALIAEYVTTYNQERRRLAREAASDLVRLGKRESEIGRELGRLIDSIAKGVPAEAIAGRIRELQSEREAVAEAIERAQEGENVIALHPTAIERYKRDVADLARELQAGSPEINAGVYSSLRELVVAVVVHAKPNKPGIKVEIRGRLAALCGLDLIPELSGGPMVARDRYRLFPHDPNPRYLLRSSG